MPSRNYLSSNNSTMWGYDPNDLARELSENANSSQEIQEIRRKINESIAHLIKTRGLTPEEASRAVRDEGFSSSEDESSSPEQIKSDKKFDNLLGSAEDSVDDVRNRHSTLANMQLGFMEQARARELGRQKLSDDQQRKSLGTLSAVQASRDQLLQDVENAPSSTMQAAKKAYSMQLQNQAATAGLRGTGFGETAQEKFGHQLGTADANLLGSTATALRDEYQQRLGVKRGILGDKAQTAGQQYGLAVGEGDQFRGYLRDYQNTLGGLAGTSQLSSGLAGLGLRSREGNRQFGLANKEFGLRIGMLQRQREEAELNRKLGLAQGGLEFLGKAGSSLFSGGASTAGAGFGGG